MQTEMKKNKKRIKVDFRAPEKNNYTCPLFPFLVIPIYLTSDASLEKTLATISGLALTVEHSDSPQFQSFKMKKLTKSKLTQTRSELMMTH